MILEILLIAFISLLGLFFLCVYFLLLAAVLKKTHPDMNLMLWDLSELNEGLIQFELWKSLKKDQNEADQKLNDNIQEQRNTTLKEQYSEYLKRGGTDDIPIWIMKNEMHELFP